MECLEMMLLWSKSVGSWLAVAVSDGVGSPANVSFAPTYVVDALHPYYSILLAQNYRKVTMLLQR